MRHNSLRRIATIGAATLLLVLSSAGVIRAHGGRAALAFWGLFTGDAARCQRVIANAAAFCARRSLHTHVACSNRTLNGGTCDPVATEATIEAARIHALDQIDASCSDQQASQLGFFGATEVQFDLTNICHRIEDTVTAMLYAPSAGTIDDTVRPCVLATAEAAPPLVRFAMQQWQNTFDRIAYRNYSPSTKMTMVATARDAIAAGVTRMNARIAKDCSPAAFASTYGESMEPFMTAIAKQAECLAGAAYVQGAIACDLTTPTPAPTPTPTPVS